LSILRRRTNITAQQVKEQEALVATLGQLDSEFDRLRQDIAIAFAPEVIDALKAFGNWIKDHHGDIIGFFKEAEIQLKISQIQLAARQHCFLLPLD
jgi:hypothetical protein